MAHRGFPSEKFQTEETAMEESKKHRPKNGRGEEDVRYPTHNVIHRAYRVPDKNAWTTETHLVDGERVTVQGLQDKINHGHVLCAELFEENQRIRLVGTIECELEDAHEDEVLIGLFSVEPSYQSKGVGGILMRAAMKYAKEELHKKTAVLWIIETRQELINWYLKLGFVDTKQKVPFVMPHLQKSQFQFVIFKKDL
ncbi:hypothetical protein PROFUN_13303 [Planoprotostelium fungivorum]|uniref:N-acetyltransferase domain-containing protein n=1 Tax=Planoprotostelium fungivorum TaxID=1890364 RepID=A0A2P6N4Q0_9EUKA|nr:hypothetical protein PROFUN_13303 [Planoprotostelium fungivorum]